MSELELRNKPIDFFKHMKCKLKCGHRYVLYRKSLIDGGMRKLEEYKCTECGHETVRFI